MENNGKGLFYGVIGVATLIVAIIGATFAYFNASQKDAETIKGEANNTLQSDLNLEVSKVNWKLDGQTVASDKLVPADFQKDATSLTEAEVNAALGKKCIDGGFTGCHVWKITASSQQNLEAASIYLDLKVNGNPASDESKYRYVVFTGTEENGTEKKVTSLTATTVKDGDTFNSIGGTAADIHSGGALTSSDTVYYVMIYYENEETDQNSEVENGEGKYTGTVTLSVAGTGQVTADFTQD